MNEKILNTYADLIVKKGVNLYEGQCLFITTSHKDYSFALILAESAYKNGAKYVHIEMASNAYLKKRINASNEKYLDFIPQFQTAKFNEAMAYDWAVVRICNNSEIETLKEADPAKLEIIMKSQRMVKKQFSNELGKHKHPWCVAAIPNDLWASAVYNTPPGEETTAKLWKTFMSILRLDQPDPQEAWELQCGFLIERKDKLNSLKIDKLIFEGPGTHLEIGLNKTSLWEGGPARLADGRSHMPNLPTEEVFTTPDFKRTSGYVKTTRPVTVLENSVKGAWFKFEEGKVIDFGADSGQDVLKKYLAIDEGASLLGEVALVDTKSPIYQSGIIFQNILFDENAASHIALGAGYPGTLSGSQNFKTEEDLKNGGCNVSLVHTDFMIGSDEMNVTAVEENGKKVPIMKKGLFVI